MKIGILGGGQLGKMLLQKAADFDLDISVMDPDPDAPSRFLCKEFHKGDFRNYDDVLAFGRTVDLLTIEIEHVNTQALFVLEKEGVIIYPQPNIVQLVQDKGAQKIFYRTHKIPTAGFQLVANRASVVESEMALPFIQKLRREGYDGRGVKKIDSLSEKSNAFDAPSVLEELVDLEMEISVIVARNARGEIVHYPLSGMIFNPEANLVEFLYSPVNVSKEIEEEAVAIAVELINSLQMIGILAVEMFLSKDGRLLVNEIAPRPHNSGHHTIEACVTSQYEQHLRAILNWPLGSTRQTKPAVMINLLGEKKQEGPAVYQGLEEILSMEETYVHLYGKKNTKPFRKMGHVTVLGDSLDEAMSKAKKIKSVLKVVSSGTISA